MQLAPTQNQYFAMLAATTVVGAMTALVATKIVQTVMRVALSALGYSKQEPAEKAEPTSTGKKCFKAVAYTAVAVLGGSAGFITFLNFAFPKGRLF